jgi:hypothetical protein
MITSDKNRRMSKILLFNVLWLANVLLAQTRFANVLFAVSVLLFLFSLRRLFLGQQLTLLAVLAIGVLSDWMMVRSSLIVFGQADSLPLPVWLVSLWFAFAWVLPEILLAFRRRPVLLVSLSAFLGPLSYSSGVQFELLTPQTPWFYAVSALVWASLVAAAHVGFFYSKGIDRCKSKASALS